MKAKKKLETDCEHMKKTIQDLEMNVRRQESEKQAKDNQIRSLQDEMAQQDEVILKRTSVLSTNASLFIV